MKKLLEFEIKSKWRNLNIGFIIFIVLILTGNVEYFAKIGMRIFGKTLNFTNLDEGLMVGKVLSLSGVLAITMILWGIDLYNFYNKPLNFMIPIYRRKIILSKIILFLLVVILIDIILLMDMMIVNYKLVGNVNLDFRNYIFIVYINLLYLTELIFMYSLIITYQHYIDSSNFLLFILLSTNLSPWLLNIGNIIFYNFNTRLSLNTFRLQSMKLVEKLNGDLWKVNSINEGLDLATVFLGLILSIILFIITSNLIDEKV